MGRGGRVMRRKKMTAATMAAVTSNAFRIIQRTSALGYGFLDPRVRLERLRLVGTLPGELGFAPAEVPERRGLLVDRLAQVEGFDDAPRRQLELRAHDLADLLVVHKARVERVDEDGHRLAHAHRVCQLH